MFEVKESAVSDSVLAPSRQTPPPVFEALLFIQLELDDVTVLPPVAFNPPPSVALFFDKSQPNSSMLAFVHTPPPDMLAMFETQVMLSALTSAIAYTPPPFIAVLLSNLVSDMARVPDQNAIPPPSVFALLANHVFWKSFNVLPPSIIAPPPLGALLYCTSVVHSSMELAAIKAIPPPATFIAVLFKIMLWYTLVSLDSE
mmetsp:Transcript_22736/g.53946  ORF Transcript_22736/g.53946 Transcript_22736/m.53946 type:complete len:200 (-) Transcript_22736:60-659(-)